MTDEQGHYPHKGSLCQRQDPYLYLLFLKPWLKSHKGIDYRLKHREILQIRFKLACLDLCKIEHTSYEPCKSRVLRGNYLKIISLPAPLVWCRQADRPTKPPIDVIAF